MDQDNIIFADEAKEDEQIPNGDFRLVCGINYFKLYNSENKRYSFIPQDLCISLFDWRTDMEAHEIINLSYEEFYKKNSNLSVKEINNEMYNLEEESIINPLKDFISHYNIKHIYIYGCNDIYRRLFQNLSNVNIYNIRNILTSCTPDNINLKKYNQIQNLNNDNEFNEINKWALKIARVYVLGYDRKKLVLNWDNVHGKEKIQTLIGKKKILVEINNYISAENLCKMNFFSIMLLRQILESEIKTFSDITKRAKDVVFLLKIIYLCLIKPNYFCWKGVNENICEFDILTPDKKFTVKYDSRQHFEEISKNLEDFVNHQLEFEEKKNHVVEYQNRKLYENFLLFMDCTRV